MNIEIRSSVRPEPVEGLRNLIQQTEEPFDKLRANGIQSDVSGLDDSTLLLTNLRAGIPHVFPKTHEAFVAQMLNLDVLGAISFSKGCYTGQEIIARTHYRGAIKRRMFRFAAKCAPPAPGMRLLAGEHHAGDVVYAAPAAEGCELLAVVTLAQADAPLTLENGGALTKLTLPYDVPVIRDP